MQIYSTISELKNALKLQTSIAFVPTMGNLHAGHIHLVNLAKQHAKCVVVSIFVNPLQFGPNEDLSNYPRTPDFDFQQLKLAGVDIVFTPSIGEIYPNFTQLESGIDLGQTMTVKLPPIANELCGASRPSHFDGVATIVLKLFNIVLFNTNSAKNIAVFGKKDFQQLFIIRELVRQFNLPITILAGETVRLPTGLAMSSRNGYLSELEKTKATELQQALKNIVDKIQSGNLNFAALTQQATQKLNENGWLVDYIAVRSALTLMPATTQDQQLVVLAAAKLGNTRLIDNIDFLR